MNEQKIRQQIISLVVVTRQDIAIAKTFILNHFSPESSKLMRRFLEHVQAQSPDQFVVHESVDAEPQIRQVASFLSWRLAFSEALWGLIGQALIFPARSSFYEDEVYQQWTTVVRNSGGQSAGWRFDEYRVALPSTISLAPSLQGNKPSPLSDGDLYLTELGIPDLPSDVEDALRQAVLCFRQELYLPAVAMVGLASEGSWIELGLALLQANPTDGRLTPEKRQQTREQLTSPFTSILRKMEMIVDLYKRQDIYANVASKSHKPQDLGIVLNWSNIVRDSRNALHYGTDPSSRNTYEKVAALLLGANQNLKVIYSVRRAAHELK
jgi:hypothetical protein